MVEVDSNLSMSLLVNNRPIPPSVSHETGRASPQRSVFIAQKEVTGSIYLVR